MTQIAVTFDAQGVTAAYPGGERRSIAWDELTMVGIRTTDEGPFFDDVFWGLHGPEGDPVVIYPNGAEGERDLLTEMQRRLPGYDDRQVIEAMGSASDAFFVVWKKAQAKGAAAG